MTYENFDTAARAIDPECLTQVQTNLKKETTYLICGGDLGKTKAFGPHKNPEAVLDEMKAYVDGVIA